METLPTLITHSTDTITVNSYWHPVEGRRPDARFRALIYHNAISPTRNVKQYNGSESRKKY